MSASVISGGLRLVFFYTDSLSGHVAWMVMELSRFLFTRLLPIWVLLLPAVYSCNSSLRSLMFLKLGTAAKLF
jgi:hypothetical protein